VAAQVEEGSWKKAPRDAIILGLKELPEDVRGPHNTLHRTIIHDLFIDGYICVFIYLCVRALSSWNLSSPRGCVVRHQDDPIKHKHVYFAHVFKGQKGAEKVLKRYDYTPAAAAAAAPTCP
jgi:hypothetical protein